MALQITRIINACVLLDFGGEAVLTDPYFESHWLMRFSEPIGMTPADLPRLTAILGGHRVFDHWRPASLRNYPHKAATPCLTATVGMARAAQAAGFAQAKPLGWGETRQLSPRLRVTAVAAHQSFGAPVNSYVLETPDWRVFVGTEARDAEPLRAWRRSNPPVDLALLPLDGATLLGKRLVMDAGRAIEGARVLGAATLFPIHYSQTPIPPLLRQASSVRTLQQYEHDGLEIALPPTGETWTLRRAPHALTTTGCD